MAAYRQRSGHAAHDRIDRARTQSFSELRDDQVVPLICPTCQIFRFMPPDGAAAATLHGVVFDIFGGSRGGPARWRRPA
jgi:hypothetical protein